MSDKVSLCHELLSEALGKVSEKYYDFTIKENGKVKRHIKRERVFCYELYYQLRYIQEKELSKYDFDINGEPDKRGRSDFKSENPDMIFHYAGTHSNLMVVEVKCKRKDDESKVLKDFIKLFRFVKKYGYESATFIMCAIKKEKFIEYYKPVLKAYFNEKPKDILEKIQIITSSKSGEQEQCNLCEILE